MNPTLTKIDTFLNDRVNHFSFSGFQLFISSSSDEKYLCGGKTSYWPKSEPISETTLFDVGSLTKVVFTTSVIARLYERGAIRLNETLGEFVSDFKTSKYAPVSVADLLSHSAGLLSWYPFYEGDKTTRLMDVFLEHEAEFIISKPGAVQIYSDLSFLLLKVCLEKRFGKLSDLFKNEVVEPLALSHTLFCPDTKKSTAATEYCLVRKALCHGEVFDLNTWFLGGVSTHAGLFANARDIGKWAADGWLKALSGKSSYLKPETAHLFTSPAKRVPTSSAPIPTWGYGWDTKSKGYSSAGDLFSKTSFGHLGFTGTSVWVDPECGGIAVFLTNRVHPSRVDERIKRIRPELHNLIKDYWKTL